MKNKALEYIQKNGISNSKFAEKIGVSESTLSRYLNGNYPNVQTIEDKIAEFLEKEEARKNTFIKDSIEFAMTSISQRVWDVLEYTRIQKNISCIYGDAGVGKTYTTKQWLKDKNDVYIITATPSFATPRPFLKLLATKLKTTKT